MANPEYTTEELEEQIIDISPDEIEIIPFDITQENVLNYKILNFPIIKGGRIVAGSGDKCFKFDETDGLWLGNADSASAPFKVDMTGALTASSVTITGLDADDITETAAKKWAAETGADVTSAHVAASITSQGALATLDAVTATEVATNAIVEAKIAADAVVAAKIAVAGLDGTDFFLPTSTTRSEQRYTASPSMSPTRGKPHMIFLAGISIPWYKITRPVTPPSEPRLKVKEYGFPSMKNSVSETAITSSQ